MLLALASLVALGLPPAQAERVSLDGIWELTVLTQEGGPQEGRTTVPIVVPGDWERVLGSAFDGGCRYARRFALELRPGERVWLRFRAAMTQARVVLNGTELGTHLGGWTPFVLEATDALRGRTQHELQVFVEERTGHNTKGFLPAVQPHFGGLWQGVELIRGTHAVLDVDRTALWAHWDPQDGGALEAELALLAGGAARAELALYDAHGVLATRPFVLEAQERAVTLRWALGSRVRPWSPESPAIWGVRVRLFDERGFPLDEFEERVGFRRVDIGADRRTILLNGTPTTLRGILHWGYEPPHLAPDESPEHWRWQMRHAKALGFNLIKACLWLPPREFYAAALEEGMLVWNEYPAWHPDFGKEHREELLREYEEFFLYDRALAPVVVRSLTCETGHHNTDRAVVEALFQRCKERTRGRLVIDDSSWISWSRFGDFYDDHPYGNCGDWLARLEGFDRYIDEHGAKPFLLGEAITSDTWIDFEALRRVLDRTQDDWWRPFGMQQQEEFERRLRERHGDAVGDELVPASERYGLAARKYQIETFRRRLPRAGYVSSVMRDIRKCRMGFLDDLGTPKWTERDWSWHGERMLVLDDARPIRSLSIDACRALQPANGIAVRWAGPQDAGQGQEYAASARWSSWRAGEYHPLGSEWRSTGALVLEKESALLSAPIVAGADGFAGPLLDDADSSVLLARVDWGFDAGVFEAAQGLEQDGGLRPVANRWRFHVFPSVADELPAGVRVARTLDPATLDWVRAGGRLLLLAGGPGSLRSQRHWFLRGAPWAPAQHPLWLDVPREMLFELQPFDFDGPMFRDTALSRCFDPVFAFWDTHDLEDGVAEWVFLCEARAGAGRILACALDLSLEPERPFGAPDDAAKAPNPARAWLRHALLRHLAEGPAPRAALEDEQLSSWQQALAARRLALDGVWKLRKDADDQGRGQRWFAADFDDESWMDSKVGIHWEHAGLPQYTGVAWYRKRFELPADWPLDAVTYLVFDGVDDSYELWVNGEPAGRFGDPRTGETVWLVRTHARVQSLLRPGANTIALRVVDHAGAGGIWKPVRLSTAHPDIEEGIEPGR